MKRTPTWTIGIVLLCTILTSSAQVSWKYGADKLVIEPTALLLNYSLWLGFLFYGMGALLLIYALKYGELSVLYPVIATSYIWVALSSAFLFAEPLSLVKISGILTIVFGVSLISYGSRKDDLEYYEATI
ncbi:MAG: EamA family transporter [Candidatus Woesearchaeota archaeon]